MTTWIELAGWTLLHFLWQGVLVGALTAAALRGATSAQMRYVIACGGLAALLAAPVVTAWSISVQDGVVAGAHAPPIGDAPLPATDPSPAVIAPNLVQTDAEASSAASPGNPGSGLPPADARALLPVVVTLWLVGLAVMLARLAGGCWQVRRLRHAVAHEPVSRWQDAADAIARRLGLPRPVLVVDSDRLDAPTVIGWLKPVVVLPIAAMATLAPSQVEAILAHELAHIRRHDFLVNMLQTIAETVLFYHPAVWWVSGRIRAEREHCCDDVAVEWCGDPVTYAAALTELASSTLARPSLALAATSGSLLARIRRLLRVSPDDAPRTSSRALIATLAMTMLIVAASLRAISVTQGGDAAAPARDEGRGFGPPDVNRLLGFELFPMGQQWPTEDPRGTNAWGVTINYANGDMPMKGFTARSLIRHAYGLHDVPIVDAPRWLDEESFDLAIASELPVSLGVADPDGLNALLRELLERRLGLVAHVEQREFPVYALVTANADGRLGPDIARSTSDCLDGDLTRRVFSTRFCGIDNNLTGIEAERVTMAEFATHVRARDALAPDLPVVDRTGLSGEYDFRIRFGFIPIAAIGAEHPVFGAVIAPFGFRSLFTALPEQLGLKLEKSTAPFEALVIDEIHRPQN